MRLTFNREGIEKLMAHARAAPKSMASIADRASGKDPKPGLWLVGDQGVYLMSNGEPRQLCDDGTDKMFVVYADEVDPTKLEFDIWWRRKRKAFGGDDGVETIALDDLDSALATYQPGKPLLINLTPKRLALIGY